MSVPAIAFDNVSKRYILRHQKTRYLKDRLTGALQRLNPFSGEQPNQTVEDFWALKDVSFEIQPGEAVGIVGPNGSGKSTTLKILAGVTEQTSGRVAVNGRLGALIEIGAGFHPELSGRENVYLNGAILGMKKAEINRQFDAIVSFAEVEKFIDTPVKHYSSGMYVRLGFAIAVHNNPEILLVDEVLAVGDLSFQRKCFDKMQELKKSGLTFILISHSMPQISSLCERAIMLKSGRLMADGLPIDVTKTYIAEADSHSAKSVLGAVEAGIEITNVRLLDYKGQSTTRVELGQALAFAIEYEATRPVSNCVFSIHLDRGQLRVYDSDTRRVGVELGVLNGKGQLRCELPHLPLMPNSYGVQAVIYSADMRPLSHVKYPHMFSIFSSTDPRTLGCGIAEDPAQRGIVYGRAMWRPLANDSPVIDAFIK
jgi:lipopolysaccharide transport system ATP-binding protein